MPGRRTGPYAPSWLARRLTRAAEVALSWLVAMLTGLRSRWRSSLQVRVVSTTLVASVIVIALLGFFLTQQIAQGLLNSAEASAQRQASAGWQQAQTAAESYSVNGATEQQITGLAKALSAGNGTTGYTYAVVVVPPASSPIQCGTDGLTDQNYCLPESLTDLLNRSKWVTNRMQLVAASLPFPKATSKPVLGLVYRGQFGAGGGYELYYFFPLTPQLQTLNEVQSTLFLVGVALVFLLAGIAWMVTRWVVVPVARAAQGAQRLATGRLDERLRVRGDDEVAALATSFNEMADSLQEKMRELQELSQVQRQFVSDVSHELRTPLTTIRMAADLLYDGREQLDTATGRAAELLQSQLGRFESLLVDLLEISRYDANAATLDAEPVDISDLARNSADVAQQLADRRGARIEFRLPAEPCLAEADRRRVERILRNLLVNAVEHGEGRDVVVTVAGDRDAVAVAVRDYGCGLASGDEHLVFDRFWRADPARARTSGGTGLGLAIALEDARLHGGWLEAWGDPGNGSVFRLTLPRQAGAELLGSPLPLAPDQADLGAVPAAERAGLAALIAPASRPALASGGTGDADSPRARS